MVEHLYRNHVELFSEVFTGEGKAFNSGAFDGLETGAFKKAITRMAEKKDLGQAKTNYKLRDWLFSRQRYWGEPFPILHEVDKEGRPTGVIEPLTPAELPLTASRVGGLQAVGQARAAFGEGDGLGMGHARRDGRYRRETNTMPQWAGSCWYYLRYLDPHNSETFC